MPSNHLILCGPLLMPSIFPNIRVFSHESGLHIRWPKSWSFSFSISPSNEYSARKANLLDQGGASQSCFTFMWNLHLFLGKAPRKTSLDSTSGRQRQGMRECLVTVWERKYPGWLMGRGSLGKRKAELSPILPVQLGNRCVSGAVACCLSGWLGFQALFPFWC